MNFINLTMSAKVIDITNPKISLMNRVNPRATRDKRKDPKILFKNKPNYYD